MSNIDEETMRELQCMQRLMLGYAALALTSLKEPEQEQEATALTRALVVAEIVRIGHRVYELRKQALGVDGNPLGDVSDFTRPNPSDRVRGRRSWRR